MRNPKYCINNNSSVAYETNLIIMHENNENFCVVFIFVSKSTYISILCKYVVKNTLSKHIFRR